MKNIDNKGENKNTNADFGATTISKPQHYLFC